ncbi:MAG: hypothetical protein ACXITR_02430 [Cyanobacterium sp.]
MSTISTGLGKNQEIWNNLKKAIAKSSGFKQWQQDKKSVSSNTDEQVKEYLRSTLETLAY